MILSAVVVLLACLVALAARLAEPAAPLFPGLPDIDLRNGYAVSAAKVYSIARPAPGVACPALPVLGVSAWGRLRPFCLRLARKMDTISAECPGIAQFSNVTTLPRTP